jgi:hypothetical protein
MQYLPSSYFILRTINTHALPFNGNFSLFLNPFYGERIFGYLFFTTSSLLKGLRT